MIVDHRKILIFDRLVSEWSSFMSATSSISSPRETRESSPGTSRPGRTIPLSTTDILLTLTSRGSFFLFAVFITFDNVFPLSDWGCPWLRSTSTWSDNLWSDSSLTTTSYGTAMTSWWTKCGPRRETPPPLTSVSGYSSRTASPGGCGFRWRWEFHVEVRLY